MAPGYEGPSGAAYPGGPSIAREFTLDFIAAFAASSKALELVKSLREIDKQFNVADLKAKAADLLSTLADVKVALAEAQDESRSKDEESARLRDALKRREETIEVNGQRYRAIDGKPVGAPYCPVCYDDGHFIMLTTMTTAKFGHRMHCPKCKAEFEHYQEFEFHPR